MDWEECTELGGSPLYGYDVFMRETNSKAWKKLNEETVFTNSYIVDNTLENDKEYEFKVEANNHAGLCSNSNCISKSVKLSDLYCKLWHLLN